MTTGTDSAGKPVAGRPIRIVTGLTAVDETGRTVATKPIRYVAGAVASDELGRSIDAWQADVVDSLVITVGGQAIGSLPARVVAGLTTTNETGATVAVTPVFVLSGGNAPGEFWGGIAGSSSINGMMLVGKQWTGTVEGSGATAATVSITASLIGAIGYAGTTAATITNTAAAGYDADSTSYFAAMTVQPDTTRKGVIDALIVGLKADGVWAKLDLFYLLAAHDAQAARLNAKSPGFNTLSAINSPVFTANRGYQGDASSAYLDAGASPAALTNFQQNSAFMALRSRVTSFGKWAGTTGAAQSFQVDISGSSANCRLNSLSSTSGMPTSATALSPFVFSRTSSTTVDMYALGNTASSAATSAARSSSTVTLFRESSSYSSPQLAYYAMGGGLTAAEAASLNSRIQTYFTAVGA
ncbi:MAG TPA: hypothetical protein VF637_12065 [Sphingomicrobium sp.]|jgi:hypothetical protein